ncbi:barstar family protein [Ornithinicoccus hortensis]|uniref:Barstar (Barnase inhibitor) n=1 Tax=Ornithinicoccus hortensis TaxID=82346 RepID=A0A542YT20_9MICO|nr:barstar family protein [Ornithinicoccus hortensis]TQL51246.1 barstar (barnase inhibitor) [Ornithinicoccus hortensis]
MSDRPWVRGGLPFLRSGPLSHVHEDAWPELDAYLDRWDYLRVELDGRSMTSRGAAHRCLHAAFGFPDWCGENWDAFNDCFGHYVVEHDGQRVAVLWRHIEEAARVAPATVAEMGWGLLACQVGDMPSLGAGNTAAIDLAVFALGRGADFDRPGSTEDVEGLSSLER